MPLVGRCWSFLECYQQFFKNLHNASFPLLSELVSEVFSAHVPDISSPSLTGIELAIAFFPAPFYLPFLVILLPNVSFTHSRSCSSLSHSNSLLHLSSSIALRSSCRCSRNIFPKVARIVSTDGFV